MEMINPDEANSLPRKLSSADFLCWLTLGRRILIGEPVSVHDSVSEEVGFVGQHPVGDVIEMEEVAEEVSNDAHAFGWAVGVAPSGQQSSLELR
jgi:hypothetical protein